MMTTDLNTLTAFINYINELHDGIGEQAKYHMDSYNQYKATDPERAGQHLKCANDTKALIKDVRFPSDTLNAIIPIDISDDIGVMCRGIIRWFRNSQTTSYGAFKSIYFTVTQQTVLPEWIDVIVRPFDVTNTQLNAVAMLRIIHGLVSRDCVKLASQENR